MKNRMRELARDYFVKHGYSPDTICSLLPEKVSRKTIYNWKNEDNWDELRKRAIKKSIDLEERIYDLLDTALNNAIASPTPKNTLALARVYGLYKSIDVVRKEIDKEETKEEKPKRLSETTLALLEQRLGLEVSDDESE